MYHVQLFRCGLHRLVVIISVDELLHSIHIIILL